MSEIKRKALIVDDSKTMREMVNFTLVREGMEVIQAEDGVEALEMANDNKNNIDIPVSYCKQRAMADRDVLMVDCFW